MSGKAEVLHRVEWVASGFPKTSTRHAYTKNPTHKPCSVSSPNLSGLLIPYIAGRSPYGSRYRKGLKVRCSTVELEGRTLVECLRAGNPVHVLIHHRGHESSLGEP